MKKNNLLLIFAISSFFFSCSSDDNSYQVKFNEAEFTQQRELWKEKNLSNYSYQYDYFASSGPYEINVLVENGIAIGDSDYAEAKTIDEVFNKIQSDYQDALNQDKNGINGVQITVSYNKEFHYPEKIYYSTSYKGDSPSGGGYYELEIKNFTPND